MRIISDLHIHSRFSRACSRDINIENLEKYARIKGVNLLGTGDFTHPEWIKEIKAKLEQGDDGILRTKTGFPFLMQAEISLIYTAAKKGRRIHYVILAPGFDCAMQITDELGKRGRLDYDGRPIFGFDSKELVDITQNISKKTVVIPAHAWTPYFGIFGSKTGFDSVEECFGEKSKYIYALETGMSCYDGETDVLTNKGWKRISDATYSDKICTLNIQNDNIEFQNPTKIHAYKYKGKMYRLKTKRVDLLVTPNHNLLYSPCDFNKRRPYRLKEAESLFGKSKIFKKDGTWIGENPEYFTLPAVEMKHGSRYYSGTRNKKEKRLPIKPWLKFFGFWLAEGFTSEGKDGDYGTYVCNNDGTLLNEIKQTLEELGYEAYKYKNRKDSENTVIRVRDYQLFAYLKQFGKCSDKFVPEDIKSLSKELLEILLTYYLKGDGHIYGRNGKGLSATTTSVRLRDDLQEIALKIGISAYYKMGQKKGTPFKSPHMEKIYKQRNDAWIIYFIRRNKPVISPSAIKKYKYTESWEEYSGLVFCVSIPNHVIYIRRNGIPLWCGNSDPAMNWRLSSLDKYNLVSFSDLHSFWPWRIGREATIFECGLAYDPIFDAIKTGNGLWGTIEVKPDYGRYHYDGHAACKVRMSPEETKKHKGICPVCGKPLTIGVLSRVEELADRPEGYKPAGAKEFWTLLPLSEIIKAVLGTSQIASKQVWAEYYKIVNAFGSEFAVLMDAPREKIEEISGKALADAIIKNREDKIKVIPGYDGEYGEPVFDENEQKKESAPPTKRVQRRLGEF